MPLDFKPRKVGFYDRIPRRFRLGISFLAGWATLELIDSIYTKIKMDNWNTQMAEVQRCVIRGFKESSFEVAKEIPLPFQVSITQLPSIGRTIVLSRDDPNEKDEVYSLPKLDGAEIVRTINSTSEFMVNAFGEDPFDLDDPFAARPGGIFATSMVAIPFVNAERGMAFVVLRSDGTSTLYLKDINPGSPERISAYMALERIEPCPLPPKPPFATKTVETSLTDAVPG